MVEKMKFGIMTLVCIGLCFNGCTFIGLAIGHSNDKAKPDKVQMAVWDTGKLTSGKKVTVHSKDGSVISGKYKGMETMCEDAYRAPYDSCRAVLEDRSWLPELGKQIKLKLSDIDFVFIRQFRGFDHFCVLVEKSDTGERGLALVDRVEYIGNDEGNLLPGDTLKAMMTEGVISYSSQILLQTDITVVQIPVDEVDHIEVKNKKYGTITLGLLGLLCDVVVIALYKSMFPFEIELRPDFF